MSGKSMLRTFLLALALLFSGYAMAQQDPTIHQVYAAAEAGRLDQAQSMMAQVLRDHPNSGKAHYVEAELLAKQGQLSKAQDELNTAERLEPGLPFANQSAVRGLEARLAAGQHGIRTALPLQGSAVGGGFPLGVFVFGLGMLALMVLAVRFMSRRGAPQPATSSRYGSIMPGTQPFSSAQPYPGGNAGPFGTPAAGGGIGSGIMGGLATGAAMGAGLAAGEALVHHFTDGRRTLADTANQANPASFGLSEPQRDEPYLDDDMGGNDFGISDDSSWDDGSSAGGDSWD